MIPRTGVVQAWSSGRMCWVRRSMPAIWPGAPLIYFSPRGRRMDQALVSRDQDAGQATLICGRFEGVDERVLEARQVMEVSLGDFVLSGGEFAAYALLDAVVRLLPGVAGNAESLAEESFADGLLEYPQYTRPREWEGKTPPETLLSGDHARIRTWRKAESERLTRERRPDLWRRYRRRRRKRAMNLIDQIDAEEMARVTEGKDIPGFQPGDTVRVNVRVKEGNRERVQAYEGVCIARRNRGLSSSFTVRKISYGEGVERVFPLYSPTIESIDVVRYGKVRRAKLYYLRGRRGKSARIAERRVERAVKK